MQQTPKNIKLPDPRSKTMETQQWNARYQQSVAMSLEGADESSHNGICENPVENADNGMEAGKDLDELNINGSCDNSARIQVVEAAIRLLFFNKLQLAWRAFCKMCSHFNSF